MKYNVRDEYGTEYKIEEIENISAPLEEENEVNSLTIEEINALKQLAKVADKLVEIVSSDIKKDEDEIEIDEDEDEIEIDDEDEDEEEKIIKEKIINTEKCKSNDSIKKSAGAIEKKIKTVDSDEDTIAMAWAKRYGGNN